MSFELGWNSSSTTNVTKFRVNDSHMIITRVEMEWAKVEPKPKLWGFLLKVYNNLID